MDIKIKQRAVFKVLWFTLFLNLCNCGLKLVVGLVSHNLTVLSDAVHGLLDALNNVVGIVAIKIAWLPPDENHPYGHRKYEALASLAIGGVMTLTSWEILKTIFSRLFGSEPVEPPVPSGFWIGLVVVGLVINLFITIYEKRRGEALRSSLLIADAAHTRSDVFVTLMSISSLLLAPHFPLFDTVLSIVVVGAILRTGWQVLKDNAMVLTDAQQLDPEAVSQCVMAVAGVENCHGVRSHGMPDDIHLDLHIVVPGSLSAAETYALEKEVSRALTEKYPDIGNVSIHHQTQMPKG